MPTKDSSPNISWVIEKVLEPLYLQRSFSDKEQVSKSKKFQHVQQDVFLEFPSFLFIIVMEKPPTQGDSTQSKVLLGPVWKFASPLSRCYSSSIIMKTANFSSKMMHIDVTYYIVQIAYILEVYPYTFRYYII